MATNALRTLGGNCFAENTRPIALCADDYALSPGISVAIATLLAAGRLSATSCMTIAPEWPRLAANLAPLSEAADIGLHLTLTDHQPLGAMPVLAPDGRLPQLGRLIPAAYAGNLGSEAVRDELRAELRRQLAAFVAALGRAPDFIDGHQHVHVLRGIRDEVLALFAEGMVASSTWLRVPWENPRTIVRRGVAIARALAITILSAGLRRRAIEARLAVNDSFRGVRDFRSNEDYPALFRRFLAGTAARPLIMCHPGHVDDDLRRIDPVTDCRRAEFEYFASDRFADDLAAAGCRLVRMRQWHTDERLAS